MSDRDIIRLEHMLKCCDNLSTFLKGKRKTQLSRDILLDSAVRHQLEILGEAANSISKKTQNELPGIPWPQIVGLRNRLIHEYFDVDYDIIWHTIKEGLPPLVAEIKRYLSMNE
ncbi:MAG: DUF86 domain-containing protein [Verrucomicrobia bacterium]|nr:DUF86 domain-containing protein [Verrucomicrobiota bacterium]